MIDKAKEKKYSLVDIISAIYENLFLIFIAILSFSLIFAIDGYFFQKPIYQSTAKLIKNVDSFNYNSQYQGNQNPLKLNLPSNEVPDLSNLELLPSIIKSDIFIDRLLQKKFDTKHSDIKTNLISIISSNESKNNLDKKWELSKNKLKKSISLNDGGSVMTLRIKSSEAKLAKDLASEILKEINDLNFVFRKKTLTLRKNIVDEKIESIRRALFLSEQRLESFLLTNKRMDSIRLKMKHEDLKREVEINKSIFLQFSRYSDMLNLETNSTFKRAITILDYPEVSFSPINDNLIKMLTKGVLFGLASSLFIVFIKLFYINNNSSSLKLNLIS